MAEVIALKADNIESCDLLSSLLQDSIFHISGHSFSGPRGRLRLLLNRFCWESFNDFHENQCYFRVHSGLYIQNIDSIIVNDNFKNGHEAYLNLLALHASEKEINLIFSNHKHVCINVSGLLMHLKDLHDRYPTPSCPIHSA
ncbi:MAG: DUF2948 family protein [Holosporaceae bacterium]|jgi:hypothetical protein|nr:DUF2948 family protein [Holosporaceae bacterium]